MNQENNQNTKQKYRVFDEMGFEVILLTDDLDLAIDTAQNHEAVLFDNHTDKVIQDFGY